MPVSKRLYIYVLVLFFAELGVIAFASFNIKPYLPIFLVLFVVVFGLLGIKYRDSLFRSLHTKLAAFIFAGLGIACLIIVAIKFGFISLSLSTSDIKLHLIPILLLLFPVALGILGLKYGDVSLTNLSIKLPISILAGLWIAALILVGFVFAYTPISLAFSDTIMIMLSAVRKLLAGEFPYTPVNEGWGYSAFCTYMPMHWLPLILPYSMGIDVRWIGVLFFVGINGLYLFHNKVRNSNKILDPPLQLSISRTENSIGFNFQLSTILPPLFLLIIPIHEFKMLGQTMELMIVAYYMFLVFALFSEKIGLQILAISLCLLSRYSLLLWLPLWVGLMFFYDSKSKALKLTGGIIAVVLIGYVLPFWVKDMTIFSQAIIIECRL